MLTLTGNLVLPDNEGVPSLYDIGWGLARTGRFGSQTETWYSVLPHVYTVAALVEEEDIVDALLHDSAEAVVSDVVTPWKSKQAEENERIILNRIYDSLGLDYNPNHAAILEADLAARAAEAELLGHNNASLFRSAVTDDEMYAKAIAYTENNIIHFPPALCLIDTAVYAKEFVTFVENAINRVAV